MLRYCGEIFWLGGTAIFVAGGQNSTGAPIHQHVKHKPVIYFFLHNVLWIFWISFVDNVDTRWKLPPICWFKNNCLVTHKVCCSTNWPIMTVTVTVLHAQASWALELFQFRVHRYVKGGLLFLKIWPPIFVWGGGGGGQNCWHNYSDQNFDIHPQKDAPKISDLNGFFNQNIGEELTDPKIMGWIQFSYHICSSFASLLNSNTTEPNFMMEWNVAQVVDSLLAFQFQFQQMENCIRKEVFYFFCVRSLRQKCQMNLNIFRNFFWEPCLNRSKSKSDGKEPIFANPSGVKWSAQKN